ncbi:MAG TPA: single-stranded DNA-binding protein [Flavisolibacter sp.]|nr:single-stranded DNA-binding protein [Flavisolibacter sp.]
MTIVGRLTRDSVINTLKDERKVVNFTIAVNDTFNSKSKGERIKMTSYFNCAYWLGDKVAEFLKKGILVEVEGRVFASAFISKDGEAKASLNCHVNHLKIFGNAKEVEPIEKAANDAEETADDMPF